MSGSREEVISFLKELRDTIIAGFETLEPQERFQRKLWNYQPGSGGGEISLLRGEVFEKAAVNWSGIAGDSYPMEDGLGPFFATGLSLITHMYNPHMPTAHFNIRYIDAGGRRWLGGGYDLTPMGQSYEEDTRHFHATAQSALDPTSPLLYPRFAQAARDYFFIPHRHRERGVGGIFFDHFATGDFARDYKMWKRVGTTFLDAILPIYRRRLATSYTPEQKEQQAEARAHYVEFNLLYDRGTKFGFQSNGNPEAILCSMPPSAKW